jgi:sortase A
VKRRLTIAACCLSLAAATALFGEQGYVWLKACVAEQRIADAYAVYLRNGHAHPPWSWADTHPVARLGVPRLSVEHTVLAGATGSSLAFGPGHIDGTASPNAPGRCVIAGHRDTVFRFLADLRRGDRLWLETHQGRVHYRVVSRSVGTAWKPRPEVSPGERQLVLVTCWPIDGIVAAAERLMVTAVEQR